MVNGQWGSTHGSSYPDKKGPAKDDMRGLTSNQKKVIKKRQSKKRRRNNKVGP